MASWRALYGTARGEVGAASPDARGALEASVVFAHPEPDHAVSSLAPHRGVEGLAAVLLGPRAALVDLSMADEGVRWRRILSARWIGAVREAGTLLLVPVDDGVLSWARGKGLAPVAEGLGEDVRAAVPLGAGVLVACGSSLHALDEGQGRSWSLPTGGAVPEAAVPVGRGALISLHDARAGWSTLVLADEGGSRAAARVQGRVNSLWPGERVAIAGTEGGEVLALDLDEGRAIETLTLGEPVLHAAPDPYGGPSLLLGLRDRLLRLGPEGRDEVALPLARCPVDRPVTAYWSQRVRASDARLAELVRLASGP